MNHDYAQRRRVAIAAAVTVIAVPVAFLLGRGTSEADTATTTAATDPAPAVATGQAPTTDPMGTAPVAYLDGSVAPAATDPATIRIPEFPVSITGTASFRRGLPSLRVCQAVGVPFNATITVTNLDNSRSVQCIASATGEPPPSDVVLHADAYLQIADLTDVPIPVEITW